MTRFIDLTGQVFGKLTVVKRVENNSEGKPTWYCKCDCGNNKIASSASLKKSYVKSCGCLLTTHGYTVNYQKSRAYTAWLNMKGRCNNSNRNDYQYYGGRNIKVCDRWLQSFTNFLHDMGEPPEKYSLDRIDVNRNYEPSNCKWSSMKEQCNNRRNNRKLTYKGETKTVTEWAKITGIRYDNITRRIDLLKWSVEKALETPVKKKN